MNETEGVGDEPALATNRTLDIAVALILLLGSAIVIFDSVRTGFGWIEGQGPAPGYFPFWVAVILGVSSFVNLFRAIARVEKNGEQTFVSVPAFARVMTVVLPVTLYILAIGGAGPVPGLGLYVASAIFISAFMIFVGRESLLRAVCIGIAIPLALFFMFERWFLVPLPKGPLEAMLGFG